MNTWILVTLVVTLKGWEPTSAREYSSYEHCMVARSASYSEKIPNWEYECVPLVIPPR